MRSPTNYPDLPKNECIEAFRAQSADIELGDEGEIYLRMPTGLDHVIWPRGKHASVVVGTAIYWACVTTGMAIEDVYLHVQRASKSGTGAEGS